MRTGSSHCLRCRCMPPSHAQELQRRSVGEMRFIGAVDEDRSGVIGLSEWTSGLVAVGIKIAACAAACTMNRPSTRRVRVPGVDIPNDERACRRVRSRRARELQWRAIRNARPNGDF